MPNDKLKRLQGLSSAKTTTNSKSVKVDGFGELVKELQAITASQQKSQESLVKSLNDLSKVILMAGEEGMNVDSIVEAINGLKDKLAEKEQMPKLPMDYEIHFERDRNLLMKSGIRLKSVPKKLN